MQSCSGQQRLRRIGRQLARSRAVLITKIGAALFQLGEAALLQLRTLRQSQVGQLQCNLERVVSECDGVTGAGCPKS